MWGHTRGQAIQLGALFLFGLAIVGLSLFQLYAVPAQNEEIEFKHDQQVQQDMQELRSAVLNTGEQTGPRSVTMSIRPTYPSRFLLTNGGPAAGTFRTVETGDGEFQSGDVDFSNVCGLGSTSSVPTNHIVHQPSYNYYSEESAHRYENTIYYRAGGSSLLNRTGQVFVRPSQSGSGGTVFIYPIQGGFQESGATSATVQFVGGKIGSEDYDDPTITVPTRISPADWSSLIDDSDVSVSSTGTANMTEFAFTGTWNVKCRPIGIGGEPDQSDTSANSGGSGSQTQINPNFQTGVIYKSASVQNANSDTVDITFKNKGSTNREMVEARFAFYKADGQGGTGGGNSELSHARLNGKDLQYIGAYEDISITFNAGQEKTVPIEFVCDNNNGYDVGTGDYFVLSIILDNGESNTYFIAPTNGGSANKPCK